MYLENNKIANAMLEALKKRMAKQHPGVVLPQTHAELAKILDAVRPEGMPYVWKGCRQAVAEYLEIPVDGTFHNWFDALNKPN